MKRLLLLWITASCLVGAAATSRGQNVATAASRENLPKELPFVVKANYPNPFHDQTTIAISIPKAQTVRVTLYNIVGSRISTLLDEPLEAGDHEVIFKRPDNLPDGIYIYTVEVGKTSRSMRMIIRK
ncbi:MAG: T9SS type A sorting domain-containing protein [Cytophagales bacterium]|nr:T9SS type A sorting domain-containing protein [Cytophagales bacterium]